MTSPNVTKVIKFGVISEAPPTLNTTSLFTTLFNYIKPKTYQIKSEHHLEYSPTSFPSLSIILKQFSHLDRLYEVFNTFNTFLLMVDIQKETAIKNLSYLLDKILEATDYETPKLYIFGFYQGELVKENKEEKVTKMIDAKGIDYEYFELDVRDVEEFSKVMDYLVKETVEIANTKKEGKHSDVNIGFDASRSKCVIF